MKALLFLCFVAVASALYDQQYALDRFDCDMLPDSGMCKAYMPRYYYDQAEGLCKKFIYGGCGGNRNNFWTEEECYNKCGALARSTSSICDQEKRSGPCLAYFPRWYYNKESNECERFIYGGCQGNENNFETKSECERTCKTQSSTSPCEMEKVVGPCRAAFVRYYYDKEKQSCEIFIYGGCRGNANNFHTKQECESMCVA